MSHSVMSDISRMTRNDFKHMTRNDFKHMVRRRLPDINAFETRIYKSVEALLIKQTRDICRKSGLPYDELRAEADLIFCRTLRRFQSERDVKFSTFLWTAVHNGLIDYGRSLRRQDGSKFGQHVSTYYVDGDDGTDGDCITENIPDEQQSRLYTVFENFYSMSADMLELVRVVFTEQVSSLEELRRICVDRGMWSEDRFAETCQDLREEVAEWV